ncbi:MAG: DUF2795 domain-containing protein [Bradymonadaceae bacterium]
MDYREHEEALSFLNKATFPLSKTELLDQARQNVVDHGFMDALARLPDREYKDGEDVLLAIEMNDEEDVFIHEADVREEARAKERDAQKLDERASEPEVIKEGDLLDDPEDRRPHETGLGDRDIL